MRLIAIKYFNRLTALIIIIKIEIFSVSQDNADVLTENTKPYFLFN